MKYLAILFLVVSASLTATAQKPKTTPVKKTNLTANASADEKTEFEKAVASTDATARIAALQKFVKNFPKSPEKIRALESIVSARAEIADEKLRLSDTASGVEFFRLAVREAPKPMSDKLFGKIILQIPTNLFFRGQQAVALETAKVIEEKVEGNAKQLLGLATFYLGTENASEAKRVAEKAIALAPDSVAAYQTLGIANRLNFQLEDAANAYAKALELDQNSVVSKRSLAEMKRAAGKTDEAAALYRELLARDAADIAAQSGLVLSLFGADKRSEAETEMQKSFAQNPKNLVLLVGAAYWYAAHNEGAKAIELAEKAIAVEPRYTWAHIALARGLMLQRRPLEAERALLVARQHGNFPTLDYEIAAARLQAGFMREAAEALKKTFAVKNGSVETKLGGRVFKEAKSFVDLLALERRASIFEPTAADNQEDAEKLKSLLDFSQKLDASETNETNISEAADEFIKGDDAMKLHRQLFVAVRLLEKNTMLPKVLELAKSAVSRVDSSLEVANPAAAVLAEELYESRTLAMTKNQLVIVPEVSRQTLSSILRGRIEDITGWALFQENKPIEATVRLKRAVSVLPEKSIWWRGSMWHLGAALVAEGKPKEALDAYIKSYAGGTAQDAAKRIVIESLYQKVYGSIEGLDQKIGAKTASTNIDSNPTSEGIKTTAQKAEKENLPDRNPAPTATPEVSPNQNTEAAPEIKAAETKSTVKNPVSEINTAKPLFEPIIITVPKTETKSPESGTKSTAETAKTAPCSLTVSQENISISSDGGSLGLLVNLEESESLEGITAASSSPKDVEIILQTDANDVSNRAFFVVKSISQTKGDFSIVFELPCGKKEVFVKVR